MDIATFRLNGPRGQLSENEFAHMVTITQGVCTRKVIKLAWGGRASKNCRRADARLRKIVEHLR